MGKSGKKFQFDCLAFKEKAQRRLYKATREMTWEEEMNYYHEMALNGPFAGLAQRYKPYPAQIAKASEKSAKYR